MYSLSRILKSRPIGINHHIEVDEPALTTLPVDPMRSLVMFETKHEWLPTGCKLPRECHRCHGGGAPREPPGGASLCLAARGHAVQHASERGGDLARLERLGEHFTDAGGERILHQARAATAAHQKHRQVGRWRRNTRASPVPASPGMTSSVTTISNPGLVPAEQPECPEVLGQNVQPCSRKRPRNSSPLICATRWSGLPMFLVSGRSGASEARRALAAGFSA